MLDSSAGKRSAASRGSEKPIKVPTVPKNELNLDYLTDGSAGSVEQSSVPKKAKLNFDSPGKIMNKTAFIKDNSANNTNPSFKPFLSQADSYSPS